MNLISISNDKKIFDSGSPVQQRMIEYGSIFDQLHIVVFTKRGTCSQGVIQLSSRVWVYSTESRSRFGYIFQAYKTVSAVVRRCGFTAANTVVTVQDPSETGLVGLWVSRTHSLPLHIQVHTDIFSHHFFDLSVGNRLRAMLARWILPTASGVRVVSERITRSLRQENISLQGEPATIPIWVDVARYQTATASINVKEKYSQFSHIILVACRLVREKNISYSLKILKNLTKTNPHVGMLIVGDGPEKANLLRRVVEEGLEDRVVWESWTNDLVSYFKTSDVYLVTSLFEGYGMALVEAAAAGCLVVSTDVGVAPEILAPQTLIPHNNVVVATKVIDRLLRDEELRKTEKETVLKNVEKSALSYQNYLDMYKKDIEKARVVFCSKKR